MTLLLIALLLAFLTVMSVVVRRSTELFVLRIAQSIEPQLDHSTISPRTPVGSRTRFIRGRIPGPLLHDLRDVLDKSDSQGTLRVVVERGQATLDPRGRFTDATLQQVRNLVGLFPVAKIRAGSPPKRS